jgi:hypothetical protein
MADRFSKIKILFALFLYWLSCYSQPIMTKHQTVREFYVTDVN